jgi:tRNA G18 (ribose-2'-O)-methylase SpoU
VIPVDDPLDSRLEIFHRNERALASRADRRSDDGAGLFMAEGDLVVERAVHAGCRPVAALVDAARVPAVAEQLGNIPIYAGGDSLRAHVTGLGVPQTIVAIFERPPRPNVEQVLATSHRLVMVEAVDNPVNVGGIVRNAAGLGWDGLILDGTSADPLSRRSLRVSMGHAVQFPYARCRELPAAIESMTTAGFVVAALTPADDAVPLADVAALHSARLAVVIGAERTGLSAATMTAASHRVRIPMHAGVDSLNAAAASAIACFALR